MTAGVSKGNSSTYEFCVDSALFYLSRELFKMQFMPPIKKTTDHRRLRGRLRSRSHPRFGIFVPLLATNDLLSKGRLGEMKLGCSYIAG